MTVKPIGDWNEVDALRAIFGQLAGLAGSVGQSSFGTNNSTLVTDTNARTGLRVGAIAFLADTVFSVLTGMNGNPIAGATFPKGLTIYGPFTALTLTSGSIVMYS
jgi:hypothetical protein